MPTLKYSVEDGRVVEVRRCVCVAAIFHVIFILVLFGVVLAFLVSFFSEMKSVEEDLEPLNQLLPDGEPNEGVIPGDRISTSPGGGPTQDPEGTVDGSGDKPERKTKRTTESSVTQSGVGSKPSETPRDSTVSTTPSMSEPRSSESSRRTKSVPASSSSTTISVGPISDSTSEKPEKTVTPPGSGTTMSTRTEQETQVSTPSKSVSIDKEDKITKTTTSSVSTISDNGDMASISPSPKPTGQVEQDVTAGTVSQDTNAGIGSSTTTTLASSQTSDTKSNVQSSTISSAISSTKEHSDSPQDFSASGVSTLSTTSVNQDVSPQTGKSSETVSTSSGTTESTPTGLTSSSAITSVEADSSGLPPSARSSSTTDTASESAPMGITPTSKGSASKETSNTNPGSNATPSGITSPMGDTSTAGSNVVNSTRESGTPSDVTSNINGTVTPSGTQVPRVIFVTRTTAQGTITGVLIDTDQGIQVERYLGVPYALPPILKLRFSDPVPLRQFPHDPQRALDRGPACIQHPAVQRNTYAPVGHVTGPTSEDCLNLNLWVPQSPGLKPVMVFIHGGNNLVGSGSEALYDGTSLAAVGDVIVVTFNYRLNVFGWFHPGTNSTDVTGNQGLKDQALVLEWVQQYIEDYGGDRNNVTLWGEISGATCALLHVLSGRSVFNRLILQSPLDLVPGIYEHPRPLDEVYSTIPEIRRCQRQFDLVTCLRDLSTAQLTAAMRSLPLEFHPVIDGSYIRASVWDMLRTAQLRDYDVIIGVNQMDAILMIDSRVEFFVRELDVYRSVYEYYQTDCSQWVEQLKLTGLVTPSITSLCQEVVPGSSERDIQLTAAHQYGSLFITCPAGQLASTFAHKLNNGKVYMYELNYQAENNPYPAWWGVPLTAELQWVFGYPFLPEHQSGYTPSERDFSRELINMWAQFTRTGIPDGLRWPPYRTESDGGVTPSYFQLDGPGAFSLRPNSSNLHYLHYVINYYH